MVVLFCLTYNSTFTAYNTMPQKIEKAQVIATSNHRNTGIAKRLREDELKKQ